MKRITLTLAVALAAAVLLFSTVQPMYVADVDAAKISRQKACTNPANPAQADPRFCSNLIVVKNVQGGTATPSQFTIQVTGNNPTPNTFQGSSSGTTVTLGEGSYQVTESPKADYTPTYSSDCSGSISAGQTKTCTVTNTYTPPKATLNVIKLVDNTNFGFLSASNIELAVAGNNPTPNTFQGSESGTPVTLDSGPYNVQEISKWEGYSVAYSPDCTGTITAGETKTCTVTNTAHYGQVNFVKNVVGGTASPSDFTMSFTYGCTDPTINCTGGKGGTFIANPTTFRFPAGSTYSIIEFSGPPGYTATYSDGLGSCRGVISSGETRTCTVTNTFTGP